MTTVHTLASGSSGNALLIVCGETRILVDAGISCRRITNGLRELGVAPDALDAILITHIHTDHICGLQTLLKRTQAPLCGTGQTCRELEWKLSGAADRLREIPLCTAFSVGSCQITAFPISHDARGACGYRIDTVDGSVGILTDTGYVTDEAAEVLSGVDVAVLAEIYAAREDNTFGISSADLAAKIPGSHYCATLQDVTKTLKEIAQEGDLILTVGAGDIFKAGEALLKEE